jgi:phthalate 4,5-dioxygenase oxygenase subunit
LLTREENDLITQTGAGTPMGEVFRSFWLPALLATELPAPDCPPVRVRLLGEDLVAFRATDGAVGLIDARCPHRRADLFFGRNEEQGLRCVYHGWKFDVQGTCIDMPNEPAESNFKHKITTTAYPCQERGGVIWAYMGPQAWQPELPQVEWSLVPDSHRYIDKYEVRSNYLQAIEGDIDNSHVSFLHSYLNPDARTRSRAASLNNINGYVLSDKAPRVTIKETDYGIMIGWRREADEDRYYWRITHWMMPGYSIVGAPEPGQTILTNVRVPIDDERSLFYRIQWNPERPLTSDELYDMRDGGVLFAKRIPGTFQTVENRDNDYLIDRQLQKSYSYTGIKGIPQQDRAVSELDPIIDRTKEHLGTSDTAIIAMRRMLLQAAAEFQREGKRPAAARAGAAYRVRSCGALLSREVPFDEGARERFSVPA